MPTSARDTGKRDVPVIASIFLSIAGAGVALGAIMLTTTARIETRLDNASTRIETRLDNAIANADADRRAFHGSMDQHRRDMQRLGERQARLEGQRETGAAQ